MYNYVHVFPAALVSIFVPGHDLVVNPLRCLGLLIHHLNLHTHVVLLCPNHGLHTVVDKGHRALEKLIQEGPKPAT